MAVRKCNSVWNADDKFFKQELLSGYIERCDKFAWLSVETLTRCRVWRTRDLLQCLFRDGVHHSMHILVLRMSAVAAYPLAVDFVPFQLGGQLSPQVDVLQAGSSSASSSPVVGHPAREAMSDTIAHISAIENQMDT